jgi:hypothetical protein
MADYDLHYVEVGSKKYGWYAPPNAYKEIAGQLGVKISKTSVKDVEKRGRVPLPRVRITTDKGKSYLRYCAPSKTDELVRTGMTGNYNGSSITNVSFVQG